MGTASRFILSFVVAVPLFGKYFEASHYDVDLRLDRSGTLTVTEQLDFHFVAGPFHFAFREISTHDTDGINAIHASMDGRDCPPGKEPGEAEIYGSSPVMVRWYFPQIISGYHSFTVQYRAAGTIRPGADSQTLVWRALPWPHTYHILASKIVLQYPPGTQAKSLRIRNSVLGFHRADGTDVLNVSNPDRDLVVEAVFPAGSFDSPPPRWLAQREKAAQTRANGLRWGTEVAVVIFLGACVWMFQIRRAAPATGGIRVTSPPSSLAPALVAAFAQGQSATLGTLFDLARRGVVRIDERQRSKWFGRQFEVVLADPYQPLAPHEKQFLALGFDGGETPVHMKTFFGRLQRPALWKSVREELRGAGWIDPQREAARRTLTIGGAIGALIGVVVMLALRTRLPGAAVPLGLSVFVAGIISLILAAVQPIWNDAGVMVAAQWKAYFRYLFELARGRTRLPGAGEFERILPYAAAFGLAPALLMRRKKEGGVELPEWFNAIEPADGGDAFVAFVSSSSASGASDGAGGGGGGDASGGGSSGAG